MKFEGEKGHDQRHGKDQPKSHQGNYVDGNSVDGTNEFLKQFENLFFLYALSINDSLKDVWYIDSDALSINDSLKYVWYIDFDESRHMTPYKYLFATL